MRVFFDIFLLFAALVLPFPVTLILMLTGFLFYPRYFEGVAVALLIELLYRGSGRDMLGSDVPLVAFAIIFLVVIEALRSFIRERTQ